MNLSWKARVFSITRRCWRANFRTHSGAVSDAVSLAEVFLCKDHELIVRFSDWYYNAGVIAFACIASWCVAVLGGGLGWVFLIMACCSTYYRTSLRRVRRNFRDDLNRELSLKRLETDTESLEWINSFLVKFWPIYQPVLAATIIASVDQVLSGATPGFLDSLKLKEFTLGSKPPRMEHVKTYPRAEDDVVIMDWKFSFTPNDTADMTSRQLKSKINPKIILEIRIGKAMISKGLDVIVADMAFSGIMRLKMKLQLPFPHIEKVEMSFLERPAIDYVCKPLGGETLGFDINFIPGLESFILEQIHGTLAPMMYAPNVFPIEVAKMLAGSPVDQAIGVVAITLHGAQGLKNPDNFSGNPDPYAVITLNKRQALAQTKTVKDNPNPRWNETHYIIVTSFNDSLDIEVFDWNEFRKDKALGTASFPLENIEEIFEHENENLEVKSGGKARGALSCDIRFFPVLEATKGPDDVEEPLPETNSGILRFTVEQAKDLDSSKSIVNQLNPYAVLLLNGNEVHTTKKLKRTNNPIWDNGSKEILITDRKAAKLGVVVKDERDLAGDQVLGTYQIKLNDMLDLMAKGKDWYNLSGAKTGRVKMQAQWRPVALSGVVAGTGGYQTPIGVMRFHFQAATSLRNFEAMGKSDPYARVSLSGIEKARTVTHRNTLNPDWDEVLYVPVHSARERLQLEVMDAEKMGKDRSLGLVDIHAADYIHQDENGEYLVHDVKEQREDGLRLHGKGTAKGLLKYTAAFYPTLNIADPEDEEEEKKEAEKEADAAVAQNGEARTSLDIPRPGDPGKFSAGANGNGDDAARPKTPSSPTAPSVQASPSVGRKSRDGKLPPKLYLTPQELLKQESGLIIFKLMEAELPRSNCRVEVFVDDMAFPSYVSSIAKSKTNSFDEIGDCFVREMEFSKLTIKIKEKGGKVGEEDKEEHTLARLTGNTLDTLKQCLVRVFYTHCDAVPLLTHCQNNPTILKMKDDDGKVSSVKVSLKYVPVKMNLDPRESINNMGNLRVDVLDGADLPSADSNGKSDPYCKFELNGQEVFKTKTQKKTLHPAWNEFFEVPVPSRIAAKFRVNVMDWDFADKPDYLGGADINLDTLEPFKAQEVKLILDGKSGSVRLRLLFRPDYVTRSKMGTSTFSGTFATPGRIVTGVAGAPVKGVTGLAHGVGKGASFIKRGFTGRKKEENSAPGGLAESPVVINGGDTAPSIKRTSAFPVSDGDFSPEGSPTPALGASNGDSRTRTTSFGAQSAHSAIIPGSGDGTATFTIVSATGYPPSSDVYVVVQQKAPKSKTIGKTKHHKTHDGILKFGETFKCVCAPEAQFALQVKENHKFSSDEDLGEQFLPVDDDAEKEYSVGTGSVLVKTTFTPAPESSNGGGGGGSLAPTSPARPFSRRSFMGKRDSRSVSRASMSRDSPSPNP